MTGLRVSRMLISDGKIKHSNTRIISSDELLDGDIGSASSNRLRALEMVNEWNRMAIWDNLEDGVWHYYLI
jgi:hypothetical protein